MSQPQFALYGHKVFVTLWLLCLELLSVLIFVYLFEFLRSEDISYTKAEMKRKHFPWEFNFLLYWAHNSGPQTCKSSILKPSYIPGYSFPGNFFPGIFRGKSVPFLSCSDICPFALFVLSAFVFFCLWKRGRYSPSRWKSQCSCTGSLF